MPESAPHLLIKALDRLPAWARDSSAVQATRIAGLEAAPVVNVIPRRAAAIIDVVLDDASVENGDVVADMTQALGPTVEVQLLTTPCRPRS